MVSFERPIDFCNKYITGYEVHIRTSHTMLRASHAACFLLNCTPEMGMERLTMTQMDSRFSSCNPFASYHAELFIGKDENISPVFNASRTWVTASRLFLHFEFPLQYTYGTSNMIQSEHNRVEQFESPSWSYNYNKKRMLQKTLIAVSIVSW